MPAIDLSPGFNPGGLLNYYLSICRAEGKSPATIDSYEQRLSGFLAYSQGQFTPQVIRQYLIALQEGREVSTVHAYFRALKTFFNCLVTEEIIGQNPMRNMKAPRLPQKRVKGFSQSDLERLLAMTSGKRFIDVRNHAIIMLFLDTGMRLKELAGIQREDLKELQRIARIIGKGNKERIAPFGARTQKAILRYLLMRGDGPGPFWLSEERRPLTGWGIQMAVKTLCKLSEIEGVKKGPHTFRHTAASCYLRNGGDIATLKALLGHSKVETTMIYLRGLGEDDVIEAHRKFSPVDNMNIPK